MTTDSKGIKDLYDSEKKALQGIMHVVMQKHSFKGVKTIDQEDAVKRAFEHEVRNRCAEIGLVVSVQWDPNVSDDPSDQTLYWNPRVIVDDRTETLPEYDHTRQQWEVTKGVLDGKPGYIRPDGTRHEDPVRKDIF